ncbi:MAG: helix-turn-helix transcriptional regulator [Desulfobacterales bacterium]|nr:helix-turn-helix transcriptional regulator [Desulfobacterales bacterium]
MKSKPDNDPIIIERLATARESIGYNLKEAAKALGFRNYQTLSSMEKEERKINAHELVSMAKLYNRTLDYFFVQDINADPAPLWRKAADTAAPEHQGCQREFLAFLEGYRNLEHLLNLKRKGIDIQIRHTREDFLQMVSPWSGSSRPPSINSSTLDQDPHATSSPREQSQVQNSSPER